MIHRRHDCLRVALLVRVFVVSDPHREEKREEEALCCLTSQAISVGIRRFDDRERDPAWLVPSGRMASCRS